MCSPQATAASRLDLVLDRDAAWLVSPCPCCRGSQHRPFNERSAFFLNTGIKCQDDQRPKLGRSGGERVLLAALERLIAIDLVKEVTGRQRNRVYAYVSYVSLFSEGTEPLKR